MKKRIFMIIAAVMIVLLTGVAVVEMIFIKGLKEENDRFNRFFETNFDMEFENWNGHKLVYTEKELVDVISDALDEAAGIYVNGKTVEEFVKNLVETVMGSYEEEIHEIYDDTAVIEAYKSGDSSALSEEDLFTLEFASDVIDEIITEDMTDYEKELAVYNWLFYYVNYDETEFSPIDDDAYDLNYYPYGVFKSRSAICVGNATTIKLFLGMLDIPCMIIHSTEEGEHAWNLVCLEEEWYHMDISFDSGFGGEPCYDYFNVPDKFKLDGGYPWDTDEFPEAKAIKYTYILQDRKDVESIEEVPQLVKDALDGKKSYLVVQSDNTLPGVEDLLMNIESRLDGSQWLYLLVKMKREEKYIYVIQIYDEKDFMNNWGDEWDDEESEDDSEDDSDRTPNNMDTILDSLF